MEHADSQTRPGRITIAIDGQSVSITLRQSLVLHLYYREGWSDRRIGKLLGCAQQSVHESRARGITNLAQACEMQNPVAAPLVEGVLGIWTSYPRSRHGSVTTATREESLTDRLEAAIMRRESELADIAEVMAEPSCVHELSTKVPQTDQYDDVWMVNYHPRVNHFDQWESRALNARTAQRLSIGAYRADKAAAHCAAPPTCTIAPRCEGCVHAAH